MEQKGQRIKGSKLIRDFCCVCNEPIRITFQQLGLDNICNFCNPKPKFRRFKDKLNHLADYEGNTFDVDK